MMNHRQRNPFEVLGIHPSGLTYLKPDQVLEVVNAMYRTLARHHHPDHASASSKKRFQEVVSAHEELTKDKEALRFWLSSLRTGGKKQLQRLMAELDELQETKTRLEERLVEFWGLRKPLEVSGICKEAKLTAAFGLDAFEFEGPYLIYPLECGGHAVCGLKKVSLGKGEAPPESAIWPHLDCAKPYYWQKSPEPKRGTLEGIGFGGRLIGGIPRDTVNRLVDEGAVTPDVKLIAGFGCDRVEKLSVPLETFLPYVQFVSSEIVRYHELVFLTHAGRVRFGGYLIEKWELNDEA